MSQRRFVVLDRDGTLIVEHHYLSDRAQVELLTGASGALCLLRECGLGLVVITNQSGLGPGALHRSGQKMPLPAVSSIDTLTYNDSDPLFSAAAHHGMGLAESKCSSSG